MTDRSFTPWSASEDEALRDGLLVAGRTPGACQARRWRLGLIRPIRPDTNRHTGYLGRDHEALEDVRLMVATLGVAVWREIAGRRRVA